MVWGAAERFMCLCIEITMINVCETIAHIPSGHASTTRNPNNLCERHNIASCVRTNLPIYNQVEERRNSTMASCEPFLLHFSANSTGDILAEFFCVLSAPQRNN